MQDKKVSEERNLMSTCCGNYRPALLRFFLAGLKIQERCRVNELLVCGYAAVLKFYGNGYLAG